MIVDTTKICSVEDRAGLVYRGYSALELAERASFETTAYLVVHGTLPDATEAARFADGLRTKAELEPATARLLGLLPRPTEPMDLLRTVVSATPTSSRDPREALLELGAKFPRIVSDGFRSQQGQPPLPALDGTYAERLYYLLTGRADPIAARRLETLLVLYMEHEFNASTWALRVTASTLADPRAALTTALATLKGPLHGGANQEILDYVFSIRNPDDAVAWVDRRLARKEKIMGFGHRVYKTSDPRAQLIKHELRSLATEPEAARALDSAVAIESAVWERKKLPANLDFYGALYMHLLGIDNRLFTPLFAASRVFGWTAHYLEQVAENRLIRPDAEYVGPVGLTFDGPAR